MFNRRKLLITLCILACILLAGGFVGVNLLGWWSIPLLGSLYANGWWTLLLILPSLTMFALDGYSRPALALLSAGLLLFANTRGMLGMGVLDAAVPTLFATVASGAAVEITAKIANRQRNAPRLENKKKKELEDKSKVFAPENVSSSQPKPAGAPVQPPKSPASPPQAPSSPQPQASQPWNRSFKEGEAAAKQTENKYSRPAQTGGTAREPSPWAKPQKGWDPSKTYRNPKDRRISQGANVPQPPKAPQTAQPHASVTTQKQSGTANVWKREGKLTAAGSFPEIIAFFNNRKASSSHQNLIGGRVISVFGDAKLTLRDADYSRPIEISLVSLFGSSRVEVPYVSNIRVYHLNLFGDCKDRRRLVNSSAMPLITIQCISLFGDCQIL
ncbi:MAG: hypothetical protein HFE44_02370 [Oscillospiraceae bacterium]|jgi:hypothetical protein|nr:hypothetical protein [Oscillospiraceae bacterium]